MSRHAVIVLAVLVVCTPLTVGLVSGAVSEQASPTGESADPLSGLAPLDGEDAGDTTQTAQNSAENTTESTQETIDETTETTQETTENTADTTQEAAEGMPGNTTESTQETTDTATTSETTENTTTSAADTTDTLQSTVNTTANTSESASGLSANSILLVTREETRISAATLNGTVTAVTAGLKQQWSTTTLTDGPTSAVDTASEITARTLGATVSTDGATAASDTSAIQEPASQRTSPQPTASTSNQRGDASVTAQSTARSATKPAVDANSETRPALQAAWLRSPSVPSWGGTAAVGGVFLLGLGYIGRRVTTTQLLTGGGLSGWQTLSPVRTRIRVSASLVRAGIRANEFTDPLRHLPLIGGYSRWDDTDPLEHEKRATIYEHLEEQPGTYLSSLAEKTGIALPTVRYHLKILQYEDCIESAVIRGKRRFFPAHVDSPSLVAALEDTATKRVLEALRVEEPASVSQLADSLDRDPGTITHHCKELEAEGLINRERDGRAKLASLTPEVRATLRTMDTPAESPQPTVADD